MVSAVVWREIVRGQTYVVMSLDGLGQAQIERRYPVGADQDRLVMLEMEGKHLLIPQARVDALVEVD
jgi:hypothetical protein